MESNVQSVKYNYMNLYYRFNQEFNKYHCIEDILMYVYGLDSYKDYDAITVAPSCISFIATPCPIPELAPDTRKISSFVNSIIKFLLSLQYLLLF